MTPIIVKSKVDNDGTLRVHLPIGENEAGKEVQVTVESVVAVAKRPAMSAIDILNSGLVGIWADRKDIDDNHKFAHRLREQAQTRRNGA